MMNIEQPHAETGSNRSDQSAPAQPSGRTRGLSWVVALLVPVALVLTAMRLMMTTVFLRFEYNLPNFPPDPYGFTTADRLYYSQFALDYLLNPADISYLGDLEFEDGSRLYNDRELRHMVDVKVAVRAAQWARYLSYAALLVLWLWAWRAGWLDGYRVGLARGGWLTVGVLAALLLLVLLSFGVFFVAFHNIFFEQGTWVFRYSDTLIRLFPERFWRDIFLYVGLLSMGAGLALGIGFCRRV